MYHRVALAATLIGRHARHKRQNGPCSLSACSAVQALCICAVDGTLERVFGLWWDGLRRLLARSENHTHRTARAAERGTRRMHAVLLLLDILLAPVPSDAPLGSSIACIFALLVRRWSPLDSFGPFAATPRAGCGRLRPSRALGARLLSPSRRWRRQTRRCRLCHAH